VRPRGCRCSAAGQRCSARAACKRVPIYDTLVIVFLCVHYGLMAVGLAVAAAQRVAVRKKLRLKGCCGCMPGSFCSFAGDWCLLFWCLGCALCQVSSSHQLACTARGHVHVAVLPLSQAQLAGHLHVLTRLQAPSTRTRRACPASWLRTGGRVPCGVLTVQHVFSTLQTAAELRRAQERRTLHRLRVKYGVVGADLAQGVDLGKAPRCAGQHSVVAASHASWAYEPEMSGHMKAAGHV